MNEKEQPPVKRPRRMEICAVRNPGTIHTTVIWKEAKYVEEKEKKCIYCQRIHRTKSPKRKLSSTNDNSKDKKKKNSDSAHTNTRDSKEDRSRAKSTKRKHLSSNDDSKDKKRKNSDSVPTSSRDSKDDRDKKKERRKKIKKPAVSSTENEPGEEKTTVETTPTVNDNVSPIKNTARKSFRIEMPRPAVSHSSAVNNEQRASSDGNRDSATSQRLSLKRKRIEEALNSSHKKAANGNKTIPLPYFPLNPNQPMGMVELMEQVRILKAETESLKWDAKQERERSNAFKKAYLREHQLNKELRQERNALQMEEERREAALAPLPPFDLDELDAPEAMDQQEEVQPVELADQQGAAEEQQPAAAEPEISHPVPRRGRGRPRKPAPKIVGRRGPYRKRTRYPSAYNFNVEQRRLLALEQDLKMVEVIPMTPELERSSCLRRIRDGGSSLVISTTNRPTTRLSLRREILNQRQ